MLLRLACSHKAEQGLALPAGGPSSLRLAWFAPVRHNLFDEVPHRYFVGCGRGEIAGFRPLRRSPRGKIYRTESDARVARPWIRWRNEVPRGPPAIGSLNCYAGGPKRHRRLAQLQRRAAAFHRSATRRSQAEWLDFLLCLGRRLSRCIAGETRRTHCIPAGTVYRSIRRARLRGHGTGSGARAREIRWFGMAREKHSAAEPSARVLLFSRRHSYHP